MIIRGPLSDDTIGATDVEGHLFGFELISDLLRTAKNAEEVAAVAQKFGKEDNISVIAVTRTAVHHTALA